MNKHEFFDLLGVTFSFSPHSKALSPQRVVAEMGRPVKNKLRPQ